MRLWSLLSAIVLAVLLVVPFTGTGSAEMSVGIAGGVVLPNEQDLTLKTFGSSGQLVERTDQNSFHPSPGPIFGVTLTYWWDSYPWLGAELSLLHWEVGGTTRFGRQMSVSEKRTGLFANILGRYPSDPSKTYFYGGFGIGRIDAIVSGGDARTNERTDLGANLIAGVAVPLSQHLRLRIEGRLIAAHDVDAKPRRGTFVETSGTPTAENGHILGVDNPHWDTFFPSAMLVLEYVFK